MRKVGTLKKMRLSLFCHFLHLFSCFAMVVQNKVFFLLESWSKFDFGGVSELTFLNAFADSSTKIKEFVFTFFQNTNMFFFNSEETFHFGGVSELTFLNASADSFTKINEFVFTFLETRK